MKKDGYLAMKGSRHV